MAILTAPIEYVSGFIADPDATYGALLTLPWQRHKGAFGYPVPRDEVWIAPYPYRYSGRLYPAYEGWTKELLDIKAQVECFTKTRYDSVLCNLYKSGNDSVAFHCEREMSSSHPIASISLGAIRDFVMKPKNGDAKEKIALGNGSLLVMHAGMQETWEHAVLKTTKDIGGRINLTFRVMTGNMS
jgi:alkylated DNA repair dioxygenase AlkB